jgi:hypothetical protein
MKGTSHSAGQQLNYLGHASRRLCRALTIEPMPADIGSSMLMESSRRMLWPV